MFFRPKASIEEVQLPYSKNSNIGLGAHMIVELLNVLNRYLKTQKMLKAQGNIVSKRENSAIVELRIHILDKAFV